MRIFVDCTDTNSNGMNTGIQRVVRNIANHCADIGAAQGLLCQPVILAGDQYRSITKVDQTRTKQRVFSLRYAANKGYFFLVRKFAILLPSKWQRFLTGNKHEHSLAGALAFLFSPLLNWILKTRRRTPVSSSVDSHVVQFQEGDVLLLADCVWNYSPWVAAHAAKVAGAKVATVIYDIIPVTHSQFFAPSSAERFAVALSMLLENADTFLCISTYTELQLRTYFAAHDYSNRHASKKISTFTLGVELDSADSRDRVRQQISAIFSQGRSVYLVVGTLEPRKNHAYLLHVFNALWNQGGQAILLIVGRVGWMCDELQDAIRSNPRTGQQLIFLDDVTDTELDFCYAHARALLFPAIVEGFGLPIIEALQKNLPVFASDIPVFREVGGDNVVYFDNMVPASLVSLLQEFEATGVYPARLPEDFTWPDWSQSTQQLLSRIVTLVSTDSIVQHTAESTRATTL